MKIKDEVFANGSFNIKDGAKTRFWDDAWEGQVPFKAKYPSLFTVVRDPHATVAKVLATRPLNLYFRRALVDNKLVEWQNLVAQIAHVQLVDGSDTFRWNLTNSGSFTVRSFYLHLLDSQPPFRHKMIWKLKIPLKIKTFLWFLQRGILLTKDNLAKKNWTGSQKCCGCNSNETIQHLFLDCPYARLVWRIIFFATGLTPPRSIRHMFNSWLSNQSKKIRRVIWVGVAAVCWAIWRCRNDLIFNKIKVNSVLQVIFRGTYWFRVWAQLQREEHAKNTFSSLSRLIEIVALDLVKGGCKHVYRLQ